MTQSFSSVLRFFIFFSLFFYEGYDLDSFTSAKRKHFHRSETEIICVNLKRFVNGSSRQNFYIRRIFGNETDLLEFIYVYALAGRKILAYRIYVYYSLFVTVGRYFNSRLT